MASEFKQYFSQEDEVKINGQYMLVGVYEFETEEEMERFLTEIGGCPHPLGGLRAVLETAAH